MDGCMGTHVDRMPMGPVCQSVLHTVFVAYSIAVVGPAACVCCVGLGLHVCDECLSQRPCHQCCLAAIPMALTWGVGHSETGVHVHLPLLGNVAVDMVCDPVRHVLKGAYCT